MTTTELPVINPEHWPRLRGNTTVVVVFDSTDETRIKASRLATDMTMRELSEVLIEMHTYGWLTALDTPWTFRASVPKLVPPGLGGTGSAL